MFAGTLVGLQKVVTWSEQFPELLITLKAPQSCGAFFIRKGADTSKLASILLGCRNLLAGDGIRNRQQAGSYKLAE